MQSVRLSDPPADALAAIDARMRPRRSAWGAAAAPLVVGVLAFALRQDGVGALLLLIGLVALIGLWLYGQLGGERRTHLEAGRAGEEAVRCALAGLDDRYYLLNGVTVPGERMEIDHLLAGPRGLFVLETKAHGGTIVYDPPATDQAADAGADTAVAQHVGINGSTDTFIFPVNFGNNTVANFETTQAVGVNHDVLQFDHTDFATAADALAAAHPSGSDTIITLSPANTVTLHGIDASTLHQSDFHIV